MWRIWVSTRYLYFSAEYHVDGFGDLFLFVHKVRISIFFLDRVSVEACELRQGPFGEQGEFLEQLDSTEVRLFEQLSDSPHESFFSDDEREGGFGRHQTRGSGQRGLPGRVVEDRHFSEGRSTAFQVEDLAFEDFLVENGIRDVRHGDLAVQEVVYFGRLFSDPTERIEGLEELQFRAEGIEESFLALEAAPVLMETRESVQSLQDHEAVFRGFVFRSLRGYPLEKVDTRGGVIAVHFRLDL